MTGGRQDNGTYPVKMVKIVMDVVECYLEIIPCLYQICSSGWDWDVVGIDIYVLRLRCGHFLLVTLVTVI